MVTPAGRAFVCASIREMKTAICARVTIEEGEYVVGEVPAVTPISNRTRMALFAVLLTRPMSEKMVSSGLTLPARTPPGPTSDRRRNRCRNTAIWLRLTSALGEKVVAEVPRVMPRLASWLIAS